MQIPLEIAFRGVEPSPAIEQKIREKAAKLERFYDRITSCRVAVELPHQQHRKGNQYRVRIELTVPGREIVVARDPAERDDHGNVYAAIQDAFDAVRRQLQDFVSARRDKAKAAAAASEAPPHGRVTQLFAEEGYGFITTPDGHEVYFHRNAVSNGGFDRLQLGDEVRFHEEMGEQGPQASVVHPVGRHHHLLD
ncbi:MAG: raiA ribosome-associated inhibitor A [Planctomycetota bacterium]|nr:MAG: raiA ribosome-associated inhibitor A [Planctomycetota bacterium]